MNTTPPKDWKIPPPEPPRVLKITSERDLIHLLGQALEETTRGYSSPEHGKRRVDLTHIGLHEYMHYCYRRGDFGSDLFRDVSRVLQGGNHGS